MNLLTLEDATLYESDHNLIWAAAHMWIYEATGLRMAGAWDNYEDADMTYSDEVLCIYGALLLWMEQEGDQAAYESVWNAI